MWWKNPFSSADGFRAASSIRISHGNIELSGMWPERVVQIRIVVMWSKRRCRTEKTISAEPVTLLPLSGPQPAR